MQNKKIYIEAGANNGIEQSRSLFLSNNPDYFGILIEPDFGAFSECQKSRGNNSIVINCALVSKEHTDETIKIFKHNSSLMNSCLNHELERNQYSSQMECQARTLQSILDEHNIKNVDYLFLDVEGFEHEVLNGIDFSKTKFDHIEVESHFPFLQVSAEEDQQRFVDFFEPNGYVLTDLIKQDGLPKLIFKPSP